MTPEEARAILEAFNRPPSDEELETAYLWWLIQHKIAFGGTNQARQVTNEAEHARSAEICALHAEIVSADKADPPRSCTEAKQRMQALYQQIHDEAELELRQEGLPPAWRRGAWKN